MNTEIKNYLENAKRSEKLISLKDEVNLVFQDKAEAKKMYLKIWNIVKNRKIHTEKLYQVIHIRYNDFLSILENLQ